jgi:protocatechuate 3,4-dioxygenase beta subunit
MQLVLCRAIFATDVVRICAHRSLRTKVGFEIGHVTGKMAARKETIMSADDRNPTSLTRRDALRLCLVPVGVATAGWLVGCASDSNPFNDPVAEPDAPSPKDAGKVTGSADAGKTTVAASGDASSTGARDAGSPVKAPVDAGGSTSNPSDAAVQAATDAGGSADAAAGDVAWASGGTKSMQGNYPDPFATGAVGAACALYPAQTIGPCYSDSTAAREDISDGITGLPLRLSFLVVRADGCTPVPNAEVDIWHTGSNGVYSAYASGICNPDKLPVASLRYCRGTQNTDDKGRTNFSTVFPGWYTGRSIHIHFTVNIGGKAYITSQLYFEDTLTEELLLLPDYKARGMRDTTNKTDNTLRGTPLADVLLATAKRQDGVLHAWKVLSIKS